MAFTERQKEILGKLPDQDRVYQEIVYRAAGKAYGLIPEDTNPEAIRTLLQEVTELFNFDNLPQSYPLPRLPEEYSSLAKAVLEAVSDGSVHSASSALIELKKILEEIHGIPFTPTGLTGAVISITPKGATAGNERDWRG